MDGQRSAEASDVLAEDDTARALRVLDAERAEPPPPATRGTPPGGDMNWRRNVVDQPVRRR